MELSTATLDQAIRFLCQQKYVSTGQTGKHDQYIILVIENNSYHIYYVSETADLLSRIYREDTYTAIGVYNNGSSLSIKKMRHYIGSKP